MIILFSDTELNQRAVRALLAKKSQSLFSLKVLSTNSTNSLAIDPLDDTLTIIDLNANGRFQELYAPQILAQQLVNVGFLNHVQTIQLLVSDIERGSSMWGYATDLGKALIKHKPDSNIIILAPGDLTKCVVIEPPQISNDAWTVYMGSYSLIKNPPQIDVLEFYKTKLTPVLTDDMDVILQNPDYKFSLQTIQATEGSDDEFTFPGTL